MSLALSDFAGVWTIRRDITQDSAIPATFVGQGEWTFAVEGMDYIERGVLQMADQPPMKAERRYRWDADLNIYFEDGRFFHQVPPKGGEAAHWCDPDQYDVTYDFSDWPMWSCTWKVKGPFKNYWLRSCYTKT